MALSNAQNFFALLPGTWRLERSITGSQQGEFEGTATFRPESDTRLSYEERGTLTLPQGQTTEPYQNYIYTLEDDDLHVLYKDGSPFLTLAFEGSAKATAGHLCIADQYDATYSIVDADAFSLNFIVKGPAKDYVSRSRFTRLKP